MRKIPHFLKKIPIFSSNWGSEIGSKYANFSDFWALLPDPETTSLILEKTGKKYASLALRNAKKPAKNTQNRHWKIGISRPGFPRYSLRIFCSAAELPLRPRVWQTDFFCWVTGHFVQFCGCLDESNSEIFVGVVSEKWSLLCVEAAIPPSQSAVQRRPPPHKGFAGFTS